MPKCEEQHLISIDLETEDMVLSESGCPHEIDNLYECPIFHDVSDDDDPETIECAKCGRIDWKKKPSLGRQGEI